VELGIVVVDGIFGTISVFVKEKFYSAYIK
jgi:hypothetical protein